MDIIKIINKSTASNSSIKIYKLTSSGLSSLSPTSSPGLGGDNPMTSNEFFKITSDFSDYVFIEATLSPAKRQITISLPEDSGEINGKIYVAFKPEDMTPSSPSISEGQVELDDDPPN